MKKIVWISLLALAGCNDPDAPFYPDNGVYPKDMGYRTMTDGSYCHIIETAANIYHGNCNPNLNELPPVTNQPMAPAVTAPTVPEQSTGNNQADSQDLPNSTQTVINSLETQLNSSQYTQSPVIEQKHFITPSKKIERVVITPTPVLAPPIKPPIIIPQKDPTPVAPIPSKPPVIIQPPVTQPSVLRNVNTGGPVF